MLPEDGPIPTLSLSAAIRFAASSRSLESRTCCSIRISRSSTTDRADLNIDLVYWCGGNPFHDHQDLNRLIPRVAAPLDDRRS